MEAVLSSLDSYWEGFSVTLELLAIGGLGALLLGVVVAFLRISPIASLRWLATGYTELMRNTPLTLVFFFLAIVLPALQLGIDFKVAAYLALALYTSAFVAEAVRSGINGVPVGQAEAARSVGLTFGQTVSSVIMPQAVRMVIPPLINVLIALTKNTSVAGAFFVKELFASAQDVINLRGDQVFAILIAVAVFYLIVTVTLGRVAAVVERRVAVLR